MNHWSHYWPAPRFRAAEETARNNRGDSMNALWPRDQKADGTLADPPAETLVAGYVAQLVMGEPNKGHPYEYGKAGGGDKYIKKN